MTIRRIAMVGHNPHRIEGKARDAERAHGERVSMRGLPSEKDIAARIAREPTRYDAEEMRGGMRRGVRSRIHEAEGRQED